MRTFPRAHVYFCMNAKIENVHECVCAHTVPQARTHAHTHAHTHTHTHTTAGHPGLCLRASAASVRSLFAQRYLCVCAFVYVCTCSRASCARRRVGVHCSVRRKSDKRSCGVRASRCKRCVNCIPQCRTGHGKTRVRAHSLSLALSLPPALPPPPPSL